MTGARVFATLGIVSDTRRLEARAQIARLRAEGHGWKLIASTLNARNVPTPSGAGRWHRTTAQRVERPEAWAAYMRRYRAGRAERDRCA